MSKKIYYVVVETRHDRPVSVHFRYAAARREADGHNQTKHKNEPLHVVLPFTQCTFMPQEVTDYYAEKENEG